MMKTLTLALLFFCSAANAQFSPNQVLTAAGLNGQFAQYLPLAGGTVTGVFNLGSAATLELNGSTGTSGQVLESAGAGAAPTWTTLSGASGTVTSVNVSGGSTGLTFSGGPITGAGTITEAGTLAIANGGTGAATQAGALTAILGSSSVPVANGGTNCATASGTCLDNITGFSGTGVLTRTGAGAYAFVTSTGTGNNVLQTSPSITTPSVTGSLNLASASTTLLLNGATGTAGQVLESGGAGAVPTWNTVTGTGTVTSVQVSGGTTGLTFSGGPITGSGTITQAGTLAIANGGTGATTQAAALTAVLGSSTVPIANGGTGQATQAAALTAILGSSAVPIANGGTGQTTKAAAFNALTPATTTGDLIYESATNTSSRLPIGSTNQVLTVVSGAPAWAAAGGGSSVVSGFIHGFTLSDDATSPNTVLDMSSGYASNSASTAMITGTAFTKSTAGTWTAGTGNNGMGTGLTIAASTWYHVFAIINAGSYDVYFDTSPTAANAPAGTTSSRYIGSFLTNASSQITPFVQWGQTFKWVAQATDLNSGSATSQTNVTVSAPLGFVTHPIEVLYAQSGAVSQRYFVYPSSVAAALAFDMWLETGPTSDPVTTQITTTTNTASQISYVAPATGTNSLTIYTTGYVNPYVAPNF
jgi:hypothetical protein